MPNESNEKGFTLFEMVISTMLFGIVITLVWNIFFTSYNNSKRVAHHNAVLEEMRALTTQIEEGVKRAKVVEIGYEMLKQVSAVDNTSRNTQVFKVNREESIQAQDGISPLFSYIKFQGTTQEDVTEVIALKEGTEEQTYELVYYEEPKSVDGSTEHNFEDNELDQAIPLSNALESVNITKDEKSNQVHLTFTKKNLYDENKPHEYVVTVNLKYKWK